MNFLLLRTDDPTRHDTINSLRTDQTMQIGSRTYAVDDRVIVIHRKLSWQLIGISIVCCAATVGLGRVAQHMGAIGDIHGLTLLLRILAGTAFANMIAYVGILLWLALRQSRVAPVITDPKKFPVRMVCRTAFSSVSGSGSIAVNRESVTFTGEDYSFNLYKADIERIKVVEGMLRLHLTQDPSGPRQSITLQLLIANRAERKIRREALVAEMNRMKPGNGKSLFPPLLGPRRELARGWLPVCAIAGGSAGLLAVGSVMLMRPTATPINWTAMVLLLLMTSGAGILFANIEILEDKSAANSLAKLIARNRN